MKPLLLTLCLLCLSANPQTTGTVSREITVPAEGGVLTFQVTCLDQYVATVNLTRIDVYRDGVIVQTIYPPMPPQLTMLANQ